MADNGFGGLNKEQLSELRAELDLFSSGIRSAATDLNNLVRGDADLGDFAVNLRGSAKAAQDLSKVSVEQLNTARGQAGVQRAIKNIRQDQIVLETKILIAKRQIELATKQELESLQDVIINLFKAKEQLEGAAEMAAKLASQIERVQKAAQFFDGMSQALREIPVVGGYLAKPFELAAKHARDAATKGVAPFKAGLIGAVKAAKELAFRLGPLVFLKSLFDASDRLYKINQQLGTGLKGAEAISKSYQQIADLDRRLTTDKLVAAMSKYNEELGISVALEGERARSFQLNTEYLGATAKAASRVDMLSRSIGQGSEEFTQNLAQSAAEANKSVGVHITLKNLMNEIGNMTATTLLNLRRKPEALAQAVAEAQKLGANFEQIRTIASSLLDFESSIANELESEVLVGKQLNLERARAAALTGNDLDLIREISNQVGTLAEFERMTVLEREASAKAFGLQADQLADILMKQDLISKIGDEAKTATIEQLKAAKQLALTSEEFRNNEAAALVQIQREESVVMQFQDLILKVQSKIVDFAEKYQSQIRATIKGIQDFLDGETIGKILKYASFIVAGGGILALASAARTLIGSNPLTPMWVKIVGAAGTMLGGPRYAAAMRLNQMGGLGLSRAMGARAGLGFGAAGAGVQMAGNYFADKFEENGNIAAARGVDVVSGAGQGALYGAAIGSVVPVLGTAAGAVIGGAIGLISGGVEAANRRAEAEAAERKQDKERKAQDEKSYQEKMLELMQIQAQKQADVYFDTNKVTNAMIIGTPAL